MPISKLQRHLDLIAYLVGRRSPEFITLGDKTEAQEYATQAAAYWADTPGAIAWLATHV